MYIERAFLPPKILSTNEQHVDFGFVQNEIQIEEAVNSINRRISERGAIVLPDGQILKIAFKMSDVLDYGINLIDIDTVFEVKPKDWGAKQQEYFQIEYPYQLSEENGKFSIGWILIDSNEMYLDEEERILALLHGEKDGRPFYCTCHSAQVVYTSRRRFVCMMCGMLHCVLEDDLGYDFENTLTAEEWFEYFSDDGTKYETEIDLEVIDFQDIEHLPKIWMTSQYEEAADELIFFTRSSKELLDEYYRTSLNAEVLIETGWSLMPQPPDPVFQFARFRYDVDKITNAMSSLETGILAYDKSRTELSQIKLATLLVFHSIELLLKTRLEQADPSTLSENLNNPTTIKLLKKQGILISIEERKAIDALRKLRNSFQHDDVSYNYRFTLSLLHEAMVFIDRFASEELGIWVGEEISEQAWQILLKFEPIRINAEKIAGEIIKRATNKSDYKIMFCPRCKRETLVSLFNRGSLCIFCRHRPTLEELNFD